MPQPPKSEQPESRDETENYVTRLVAAIDYLAAQVKADRQERHTHEQKKTKRETWIVIGTLGYAALTFVIMIIAGIQAYIFNDTENRQLRAYIKLGKLSVSFEPTKPDAVNEFTIPVTNEGQTPLVLERAYYIPKGLAMNETFPAKFVCSGVEAVPAQETAIFISTKEDRDMKFNINDIAGADIRDADEKKGWAIICGAANYKDVFGMHWTHRFCYMYKNPFVSLEIGYCPSGNDEIEYRGRTAAQWKQINPPIFLLEVRKHTLE